MVLSLFHFLLFAFSQIATPGPANMIMLSTGAKYGFRNALPFVFGVIVGKQIIIWPIGFGLMLLNKDHPYIFIFFKYISAGYILWLAWRIANMRISTKSFGNISLIYIFFLNRFVKYCMSLISIFNPIIISEIIRN